MANVDDRVVAMSFESTKFQSGISQTMGAMDKFNSALKGLGAGAGAGLDAIEKAASRISLTGPMSALDKLKAKFGRGVPEANQAFSDVEKGSSKVNFLGLGTAIDKIKGHFSTIPQSATQSFSEVERSSGKVEFRGLSQAIDGVGKQFTVLQGVAAVALGNIASQATMRGGAFAKSFAFGPIKQGFDEYATNLNSIQTILANTQDSGGNLKTVNAALNELNTYSDKTIYNFSEMAKNIGTFTAAGVQLKPATAAIKGIANLAALSGSNSQQASTAMYQLSQAISAGRVGLQDWNSVVNAGMGGAVFQKSLMRTAENMGALEKGAVHVDKATGKATVNGKSFRESIMAKPGEQSWLTSDVLTKTLSQFTGDLSDAQLKAQGFSEDQIKAIQAQAKTAQAAATQVKTLSQVFDVARETIGSGWSKTFQTIFGDFGESKKTFTDMSNTINGIINASSKARNKLLGDWKKLGGRDVLIAGLKQAFTDLKAVFKPIHDAFRDIFPAKTGKDLYNMTVSFRDFMKSLEIGSGTADKLRSTFKGVFALLDIGKQIIGGVFTALKHMFGAISQGGGGVLGLTGNLGDLISGLDAWLKKGDKIKSLFAGIGDVLAIPIKLIGTLTSKLSGIFGGGGGGADATKMHDSIAGVSSALKPAAKAADAATKAWDGLVQAIGKLGDVLAPVGKAIEDTFGGFADNVANALASNNWDSVFTVIQTGLVAGIFLTIKKAIGGGLNIDIGGGAIKNLTGSLSVLKGSLVDMQKNVQAHTLLTIASAMAVLTVSIVALSLVKPAKIASSLGAITVGLIQLMGALVVMNKMGTKGGIVPSASLILIATALDTLSIAIVGLSTLQPAKLAVGLGGIGGALAILTAASIPLSKASPRLIAAGVGLTAIGVALNVVAVAVKIFATMSWEQLATGLAGVLGSLVAIAATMNAMPPTLPLIGAGLVLVGVGLNAVAAAVTIFAAMDLKNAIRGIGAMTLALLGIAGAMDLMPPTLPLTAAGLILVSIGLAAVTASIALLGNMSIGTLVKGIAGIAGALLVLAGGLTLMVASLPGAAALVVAAGALAILAPVLGMLGTMKFGTIAKGLGAIVALMAVIGVGGLLAAPGLVALGLGLTVLGVGVVAAGAGVYLLAKGISILATNGGKGLAVFIAAMTGLIMMLPKFVISFLKGIIEIVAGIAKIAPLIVQSLAKILIMLLDVIIQAAPKLAQAATAIISALVSVLAKNAGPLITAGGKLLLQLLTGISNNIVKVTTLVANIITKFLGALASKAGQLTSAGATLIAKFVSGIANNLGKIVSAAGQIIARYISAIGSNLAKVVAAGAGLVAKIIAGIGNAAGKIVSTGVDMVIKFVKGIGDNLGKVIGAGVDVAVKLINAIGKQTVKLADEGAKAVIRFLHGVADTIRKREPELISAGLDIGSAIITGLIKGLSPGRIIQAAKDLAGHLPKWVRKVLGVKSPSTVFHEIGTNVVEGLANGITASAAKVSNSVKLLSQRAINHMRAAFGAGTSGGAGVMTMLGQETGQSFVDGLTGTQEDIDTTLSGITTKIQDQIRDTLTDLRAKQHELKQLREVKKKDRDWDAIREAKKAIDQDKVDLTILANKNTLLTNGLKSQKAELIKLAGEFETVTKQLDAAKTKLDDMKGYKSGLVDQFSSLPEIPTTDADGKPIADQVGAYTAGLSASVGAAEEYKNVLDTLLGMGLDDATYKKLLAEGPTDLTFAKQLVNGGAAAIAAINALDTRLAVNANNVADKATEHFYGIGINAQQGIVDGLNARLNDPDPKKGIVAAMTAIANAMIKAIKKKLKIKSPSQEFADVAIFSAKGLVKGFEGSSKMVSDAAATVGDDALSAMRNSVSDMSKRLADEMDTDPTITPILDLSRIKKDVKKVGDLTNTLAPSTSVGLASALSGADKARLEELAMVGAGAPVFNFEQNNTSPKALSETEIYRQTNNLMSQAKDALGL